MEKKLILSICIPTYNRPKHLENCLNSILIAKKKLKTDEILEVCISDNGSKHNINKIIKKFNKKLKIKYNRFERNLGITTNFLKSVDMAEGDFVWTIGDDDLLIPKALEKIFSLLKKYPKVDYYFINSYNLEYYYLEKFSHPFDTKNIPFKMERFSKKNKSEVLDFWNLISPEVSFDFLLGMFFSLFRRKSWIDNVKYLNLKNAKDKRWLATFDNSCFNQIIFANAFNNSKAYFQAEPLSINLHGLRVWSKLYAFIIVVRLPEILDYYRSRGMPFLKYLYLKNFAYRDFAILIGKILISKDTKGFEYLKFYQHIFKNLFYPNVYFSLITYLYKKIKSKL